MVLHTLKGQSRNFNVQKKEFEPIDNTLLTDVQENIVSTMLSNPDITRTLDSAGFDMENEQIKNIIQSKVEIDLNNRNLAPLTKSEKQDLVTELSKNIRHQLGYTLNPSLPDALTNG